MATSCCDNDDHACVVCKKEVSPDDGEHLVYSKPVDGRRSVVVCNGCGLDRLPTRYWVCSICQETSISSVVKAGMRFMVCEKERCTRIVNEPSTKSKTYTTSWGPVNYMQMDRCSECSKDVGIQDVGEGNLAAIVQDGETLSRVLWVSCRDCRVSRPETHEGVGCAGCGKAGKLVSTPQRDVNLLSYVCGEACRVRAVELLTKVLDSKRKCGNCYRLLDGAKRCGRCLKVHYCSPECQRSDWFSHSLECRPK